ncbi:hypothetical protein GALMADRAFT_230072 [Galerina marginata CBS 339.88]|uniref:CBM1 domain-containing protein n=1 Tax=Galerina marginata (strain CBS 339.88) TaxID=685588 RepID=A0A067SHS3_GALM3|nr:hypothetical protein GALMADRAFT_230072 [Galerina marginata CBS 339.88]
MHEISYKETQDPKCGAQSTSWIYDPWTAMFKSLFFVVAACSLAFAGNAGEYTQCGGIGYTGPTACNARTGFNCIYVDTNRSLCLPLPAPTQQA